VLRSYKFDATGNLVERQIYSSDPPQGCCSHHYSFDERNRMSGATVSQLGPARVVEYDYNGRGERVWRSGPPAPTVGVSLDVLQVSTRESRGTGELFWVSLGVAEARAVSTVKWGLRWAGGA
jgi:hypothetical protein